MKNHAMVMLDSESKDRPILIGKDEQLLKDVDIGDINPVKADFITLLEGVCTLIHVMDQNNVQESSVSLRAAIKHLEDGFADASYKGINLRKDNL